MQGTAEPITQALLAMIGKTAKPGATRILTLERGKVVARYLDADLEEHAAPAGVR